MQLFAATEPLELKPSGRSDRVKVGGGTLRTKYRRISPRIAAACAAALALSACASSEYMGLSLRPGAASPELQDLAHRAHAGDKRAQLELGIRYEEGRGVAVDLDRAKQLYLRAASDNGRTIWVYSPPVGNLSKGRVIPVPSGSSKDVSNEARQRLRWITQKASLSWNSISAAAGMIRGIL